MSRPPNPGWSGHPSPQGHRSDPQALPTLPSRAPLAITVPGAVRSWGDAHARHGRLSRADVLEHAIRLATDGFPAYVPDARAYRPSRHEESIDLR